MRNFGNNYSWLDTEGRPLVGRVSFYKLHTTEPELITDYSGTALPNPIFTNAIGQTVQQVFLQDGKDYTVVFEKYIGEADMTQDPDNWLFQYSSDNIYDDYRAVFETGFIPVISTVADLRGVNPDDVPVAPNSDKKFIQLIGYYDAGDKPAVYYVYDAESTASIDNGSVIGSTYGGRWLLVNYMDDMDVRHFGIFGTQTVEPSSTIPEMIQVASDYVRDRGQSLYFPCINGELTWYPVRYNNFVGKFEKNTRIYCYGSGVSHITLTEKTNLVMWGDSTYNGTVYCFCDEGYSSYTDKDNSVNKYIIPNRSITFDNELYTAGAVRGSESSSVIVNVNVYASARVRNMQFRNCNFLLTDYLDTGNNFISCELKYDYFADPNNILQYNSFTDCTVLPQYWKQNLNIWYNIERKMGKTNIDFQGMGGYGTPYNVLIHDQTADNVPITIRNAAFYRFWFETAKKAINFNNCSIISFESDKINDITRLFLDNSSLIIYGDSFPVSTKTGNNGPYNLVELQLENGSTLSYSDGDSVSVVTNINYTVKDSIVNRIDVHEYGKVILKNSKITDSITVSESQMTATEVEFDFMGRGYAISPQPNIFSCTILGGYIAEFPSSTVSTGKYIGNRLNGSYFGLNFTQPDTLVENTWTNNTVFTDGPLVKFNHAAGYAKNDDSAHHFVYKNNIGPGVVQEAPEWVDNLLVLPGDDHTYWPTAAPGQVVYWSDAQVYDLVGQILQRLPDTYPEYPDHPGVYTWDYTNNYTTKIKIFSPCMITKNDYMLQAVPPPNVTYNDNIDNRRYMVFAPYQSTVNSWGKNASDTSKIVPQTLKSVPISTTEYDGIEVKVTCAHKFIQVPNWWMDSYLMAHPKRRINLPVKFKLERSENTVQAELIEI